MTEETNADGKIVCRVDGARVHSVKIYLGNAYPDWTLDRYIAEYPGAPLLSEVAKRKIEEEMQKRRGVVAGVISSLPSAAVEHTELHRVFELSPLLKGVKNNRGEFIKVSVFGSSGNDAVVPDVDPRYVFSVDLTKVVLMGLELGMPIYLWGYHGTGKTSVFEQVCARTRRPFLRVQHTANTEEAHILGQYIVKDGSTVFQMGPLAIAMRDGFVYCADEYDFAMPSVLSVYQPVLEGKPLYIKDAPEELRVIRPHPNFRFVATGNTNGGGDETGLYQGTQIQNAANYSRFSIVEEVQYMDPKLETAIIASQASVLPEDAAKIVKVANEMRAEFKAGRIGSTISPREMITIAKIGILRGGDYKEGWRLGYANRLSRVDKETVQQFIQRVFG